MSPPHVSFNSSRTYHNHSIRSFGPNHFCCGRTLEFRSSYQKCSTNLQGPASLLANSAFRDIWIHIIVIAWLAASIIGGIVKISKAYDFPTPLAISILWAAYQIIPPLLVIYITISSACLMPYSIHSLMLVLQIWMESWIQTGGC